MLAHVFLAPYTLPVPFWMYLYGCAATLILSFALVAYLAAADSTTELGTNTRGSAGWNGTSFWPLLIALLRAGALVSLVLTIVAGFAGSADPSQNAAMTLF